MISNYNRKCSRKHRTEANKIKSQVKGRLLYGTCPAISRNLSNFTLRRRDRKLGSTRDGGTGTAAAASCKITNEVSKLILYITEQMGSFIWSDYIRSQILHLDGLSWFLFIGYLGTVSGSSWLHGYLKCHCDYDCPLSTWILYNTHM